MRRPAAPAAVLAAVLLCLILLGWGLGTLLVPLTHDADVAAVHALVTHEDSRLVSAMRVVTWLGSGVTLTAIGIPLAVVLLRRRCHTAVALIAVSSLGAVLLVQSVKVLVGRVRPLDALLDARGASFPSGHAGEALSFYGAVALVVVLSGARRRVRIATVAVAAVLVLAVGFSRIALGVHYPSDVLGSLLLCGAWLAATATVLSRAQATGAGSSPRRPASDGPGAGRG
jgi:membrane-associated phospholipid phosphatase